MVGHPQSLVQARHLVGTMTNVITFRKGGLPVQLWRHYRIFRRIGLSHWSSIRLALAIAQALA